MLVGCTVDDYTVWIGDDTCDDASVTNNRLECMPPREQLGQRSDGHIKHGAVQVHVSTLIAITMRKQL